MPLTNFSLVGSANWAEQGAATGFKAPSQSDSVTFALGSLNLLTWNQAYVAQLTLLPATTTTIDLTSLTNFVGESFAFAHVLALQVLPQSGSNLKIGPGATNGLQWFWDDATAFSQVNIGGILMWADPASATGTVVDSTHKTLDLTNLTALATAWSNVTAYVIGNQVSLSGHDYICVANNTNQTPPNTTYWSEYGKAVVDILVLGSTS